MSDPEVTDRYWEAIQHALEVWRPEAGSWGEPGWRLSELERAETRLGLALPEALLTWYLDFHPRFGAWMEFDLETPCSPRLISIEDPEDKGDDNRYLVFHAEREGSADWGCRLSDLHLPDPPVYCSYLWGPWVQVSDGIAEFALQRFLMTRWLVALFSRSATPRVTVEISPETTRIMKTHGIQVGHHRLHWGPSAVWILPGAIGVTYDDPGFMLNRKKVVESKKRGLEPVGDYSVRPIDAKRRPEVVALLSGESAPPRARGARSFLDRWLRREK